MLNNILYMVFASKEGSGKKETEKNQLNLEQIENELNIFAFYLKKY